LYILSSACQACWTVLAVLVLVIGTASVSIGAGGPAEPTQLDVGPWPVFHEMEFLDMTSGEMVAIEIYYPGYDRWLDKFGRDDAAPFEVIIFSPGAGGDATAYEDYLTYWASWGFVVAGASWVYEQDREQDVAYLDHGKVLDLLDEKGAEGDWRDPFNGVPNTGKVGAVGHSRGGRTAFMATSQENRILCASAWMPTLNNSEEVGDGAALQLFGGDTDEIAPPDEWSDPLYDSIDDDIVYIEVFGGDHGTDADLHPVLALDLFRYHLKGDRTVEDRLQGEGLEQRAESGEFRLRMKLGGEEYDSHPELSESPKKTPTSEPSSGSPIVLGLVLVLIGISGLLYLVIKRPSWAFRSGRNRSAHDEDR